MAAAETVWRRRDLADERFALACKRKITSRKIIGQPHNDPTRNINSGRWRKHHVQ